MADNIRKLRVNSDLIVDQIPFSLNISIGSTSIFLLYSQYIFQVYPVQTVTTYIARGIRFHTTLKIKPLRVILRFYFRPYYFSSVKIPLVFFVLELYDLLVQDNTILKNGPITQSSNSRNIIALKVLVIVIASARKSKVFSKLQILKIPEF